MAVTSYQDIKTMSADFRELLNTNKATLPFNADNTAMVVLVDVATNLQSILMHNPAKLALIIGLEHNRLTVCLLGADSSGHPLKGAGPGVRGSAAPGAASSPDDEELPGEEAWPDEEEITNSENTEYNGFFQ